MKILYTGTFGSDDPTRAGFPFDFAKGAIEAGHQPTIFLAGEAPYLLQESIAKAVHGVGWPPMTELWESIVQEHIPVHV
jgi:predicted peroxiredoxin